MAKKKGGFDIVKSGMEIVRGGFDPHPEPLGDKKCICSPGGWSSGNLSVCGCACGCPYPNISGPSANNLANRDLASNC